MPEDLDSDSADEMDIKSEPSSPTPESGSPIGIASIRPARTSPVQPTSNPSDGAQKVQSTPNEQSARLGQISTLRQQSTLSQHSTHSGYPSINSSPSGNQSIRPSVETGQLSTLSGTQLPNVQNTTPRRRQEIRPRSSRITSKEMLPLLHSALPFKYFLENLSYKKDIYERIAVDYEIQSKRAVHPSTVHKHFRTAILKFREEGPTPRERMHLLGMDELERELILHEMSHWIAGWQENPHMRWGDAKTREATAIASWVDEFENASDGYEQSARRLEVPNRGSPPLVRSDPQLISLGAKAWRKKILNNRAKYIAPRRIPPPRPRPSGVFEDTPIARDRYRGITPPRRPPLGDPDYKAKWQDEITKYVNKKIEHDRQTREQNQRAAPVAPSSSHSTTQRPLPSHIPPRNDPQFQIERTEVTTPQVPQGDSQGHFVWKEIATPQMPDPRMLREQDLLAQQATPTSHPAVQHPPSRIPPRDNFPNNTAPNTVCPAASNAQNTSNPPPQHPSEPSTMVVERMAASLNQIGVAVIAAVKNQSQDSATESQPKQTDLLQLQTSVDRLTGQVQSLEAQMKLLTEALLKK